ncbi:methylated-DNA--[protein]-cysteine S-methyltransferase [Coralloluteibacterium thermophilus]|uniref:Methylated-DNA--[protein]-cysteine S-methyltransferase n=1 Tax=Coralloluteibacterium thermophilum TaxID=2707049 RepID=A0ABV9NMV8_9GAMM
MPLVLDATTHATPVGPLSLLQDADGVLHAVGFAPAPERLAPTLRAPVRLHVRPELGATSTAVLAYFEGDLYAIDALPVARPGAGFVQAARDAMRGIAPGTTVSYAALAARCGNARAVRAAGSACAGNPVALVVPCHRVLRSDGTLGGFLWGLDTKRWLLAHEARHAALRASA